MPEQLVTIGPAGAELAGVLHTPAGAGASTHAVLFTPAGMRDRSGPMRLYTRLARRLCADGHLVLRYDGAGLGESDGSPPERDRIGAYRAVQDGAQTGDALAAARFLRAEVGRPALVVMGLCGGVYHAAHIAREAPELVAGVFAIGAPTLTIGERGAARSAELSRTWLERAAHLYLARARDGGAWRRLFSGRSDYRALLRSVPLLVPDPGAAARRWVAKARVRLRGQGRQIWATRPSLGRADLLARLQRADPRVDRATWEALVDLRTRGVPVALAWGEHDSALCVFDDFLRGPLPEVAELFETMVIAGGSHECADSAPFETLARAAQSFVRCIAAASRRNHAAPLR